MTYQEASNAVRSGIVTTIDGRKPVAVGIAGNNKAVLLYRRPNAESMYMADFVTFYAVWNEGDAR